MAVMNLRNQLIMLTKKHPSHWLARRVINRHGKAMLLALLLTLISPLNLAMTLSPIGNQYLDENSDLSVIINAVDNNKHHYTLIAKPLPPFASFHDNGNGTASLSIKPNYGDAGTYSTTITVLSSKTRAIVDHETLDIVVKNLNRAPVLQPINNQQVDENNRLSVMLRATDPDQADHLTFSGDGLTEFMTLIDHANRSAELQIAPSFNDAGYYLVNIKITDNFGSTATEQLSIQVVNQNRPPQLSETPVSQTLAENTSLNIPLHATDIDGNTVSISANQLPAFATLNHTAANQATLTLQPGFDEAGTYQMTLIVTDMGAPALSNQHRLTVIVNNSNRPPQLIPMDSPIVSENQRRTIEIQVDNPDHDSLQFSATDLPDFASLIKTTDNAAYLAVHPDYQDAGNYTFSLTVVDDGSPPLKTSQSITLIVKKTNRTPTMNTIGESTVDENSQLSIHLSATDPDLDLLRFTAVGLPYFATLTDHGDNTGIIDIAAPVDTTGVETFLVCASDHGTPSLAECEMVTLNISDTNQAPILTPINNHFLSEGESKTLLLSLSDHDEDNHQIKAANLPAFVQLSDSGDGSAILDITPNSGDNGHYTVTIIAIDNGTPIKTDTQTFAITVNTPPIRLNYTQTITTTPIKNQAVPSRIDPIIESTTAQN